MHVATENTPGVLTMKRFKFQALITLDPPANVEAAGIPAGQTRRMVVRGEHHQTHRSKIFSTLVTSTGDRLPTLADDHLIVTIALTGDDALDYFGIGDRLALWRGGDIAHGIITRRLFI